MCVANEAVSTSLESACRPSRHLVWAADADNQSVVFRDVAFKEVRMTIPARSPAVNYRCNASDLLAVKDGKLNLRISSTVLEQRQDTHYRPPWRIRKMCVWLFGEYRLAGLWQRTFATIVFQWPAEPGLHQWLEGVTVGEQQFFNGAGMNCSRSIVYPYALVVDGGRSSIIFSP